MRAHVTMTTLVCLVLRFALAMNVAAQNDPAGQERRSEEGANEVQKIKVLNEMLRQANQLSQAGDFEGAVQILTQATQQDPTHDLLWARLADFELLAGKTSTDRSKANSFYQDAITHFKKAIAINPTSDRYRNSLREAYARSGGSADSQSGTGSLTVRESGGPSQSSISDGTRREEASTGSFSTEGFVVVYNVPGLRVLKLAPEALAGIFLGEIVSWDDPAIIRTNGRFNLSNRTITVVHRSDTSGSTLIFTDYLSKVSSKWQNGPGKGTSVTWPYGVGAKGSEGLAQLIRQLSGSIGYLGLNDANSQSVSVAKLISTKGPEESSETVSTATSAHLPSSRDEQQPVELQEGQTPQEVEKVLGKPQDTITLKENLIYVYPTVKVIFEKGKLVDVQYPENSSPK